MVLDKLDKIFDNPKKLVDIILIIGVIFVLSYIFIIVLKHTQLFIIDSILDSARHVSLGDKSPDYIQGWNDCIDYIHHRLYTNATGGV